MSQQNPGQPGGYGGAPPGYGGPPYGPPPGPPAGGPPPGTMPYPGAGAGYPVAPQQPMTPPPNGKKGQVWLAVGLGCGFLLLLAIGGTVGALFWLRNRGNSFVEDLQRQMASASALPAGTEMAPTSPGNETAAGALSADCKVAYGCCRAIAAKSTGNEAAVQACEVFKMAGYPQASCASALTGYRQVAKAIGVSCE
jgi:hypothetical protein